MSNNLIERKLYQDFIRKNAHSCLLSPNGYGKSTLLTKHSDIFVDLSKISVSPECFAVEFIGTILHKFSGESVFSLPNYFNILFLLKQEVPEKAKKIIAEVHNELQKIKPDQELLLNLAFEFPKTIYKEFSKNKTLVIGVNNFQEFFSFKNFLQISDPFKILKKHLQDEDYTNKIKYIFASSSINIFKKEVDFIPSIELTPLTLKEIELLSKQHRISFNKEELKQLQTYSSGIPILVNHYLEQKKLNSKTKIQEVIFQELLNENSFTNNYMLNSYSSSLGTSKGSSLLRNLSKALSQAPRIRLTNLAKKIYKSSPVTKSLLVRLINADLVLKEDSFFTFKIPLLRVWIYLNDYNLLNNNLKLNQESKKLLGDLFDY